MKRNRWIQLGIILFITVNFLLIFFDEKDRVDRVSYVNDWSRSFTADLQRELYAPVVLAAASEEMVYFDQNEGVFQEFLVREGDEVEKGTPLFTYRVNNYNEAEAKLHEQIEQTNGEIDAIEQAISQLEMYNIPVNEFDPSSSVLITEEEIFVEIPDSSHEAELMKEQYIVEKEKELNEKSAALASLENQLSELQQTGDVISVESPYAGRVKQVATELTDPLIIIESEELHAIGTLSEEARKDVEEGMAASVELKGIDMLLEGAVDSLGDSPLNLEVDGESEYPFAVSFLADLEETEGQEEEQEQEGVQENELLPGYHGNLTITLEEVLGATAIFEDALFTDSVWYMTPEGTLEQRKVVTGLSDDQQIEIRSGLEGNAVVAEGPPGQLRTGAAFITPIKWSQLNRESVSFTKSDWEKPFVSGILSR